MSRKNQKSVKPKSNVTLYFDGSCAPRNPGGWACYGWQLEKDGEVWAFDYGTYSPPGPDSTNNVAEYAALIAGLKGVIEAGLHTEHFNIKGDSSLVINQMTHYWRVRSPLLYPLYLEAVELVAQCQHVYFDWIPRERNTDADYLSKQAYEAAFSDGTIPG